MSEGFRTDPSGGHLLQAIISYGGRRVYGAFHITFFQKLTLVSGVPPPSGQAVRLQLHFDGQGIAFAWFAAHQRADLLLNANQFLHMMSQFVCKYVSLSKVARRAKASLQFVIKSQIDINLFVGWTVERASGRAR